MRAVLILATVVDLAIAALMLGVSGFIFGSGPEGMSGDRVVAAGWSAMLVFCIAAPVIGFVMNAQSRPVGGILVASLPPVVALIAAIMPAPY